MNHYVLLLEKQNFDLKQNAIPQQ